VNSAILPQTLVELMSANVDRNDRRRTVLQQTVGEAPRGRSDVDAVRIGWVDSEP
jgi:hypothetical protein